MRGGGEEASAHHGRHSLVAVPAAGQQRAAVLSLPAGPSVSEVGPVFGPGPQESQDQDPVLDLSRTISLSSQTRR